MKFGLFIALLVLLASINVFGQDQKGVRNGHERRHESGVVGDRVNNEDDVTDDRVKNVPPENVKKVETKVEGNPISVTTEIKSDGGSVKTVMKPDPSVVSEKTKTVPVESGKSDEEPVPESVDHEESNIETTGKPIEAGPEDEETTKEGKSVSKETGFSEKKPVKESSGEIQDSDPRASSIKVGKPVVEVCIKAINFYIHILEFCS